MSKLSIGLAIVMAIAACGNKDKDKGAAGKETPAATDVKVSPDMMAFTESLHGKSKDVSTALTKWGAENLDKKDMDMYDLTSPHVTAQEKKGEKDCYTFDAKAGATTRTYETCWQGGKITEVVDKGMH